MSLRDTLLFALLTFITTGAAGDAINAIHKTSGKSSAQEILDDVALVQMQMRVNASRKGMLDLDALGPDTTETDLEKQSGMTLNSNGDLDFFLAGLRFNCECVFLFLLLFLIGKYYLPQLFEFRATGGYLEGKDKEKAQDAPFKWDAHEWSIVAFFKWAYYSFAFTREQLIDTSGLDAAMLIAFLDMGMEIMALIGIPLMAIFWPLYWGFGGNAAGDDRLSWLGINNVVPGSWIFWPLSVSTWFVVAVTQYRLFQWMRMFIRYREEWLMSMPAPQDATILVEGIPDEQCSDAALKKYFQRMYGHREVKEAYVVKKISKLESMVEEYKRYNRHFTEVLWRVQRRGGDHHDEGQRPREQMDKLRGQVAEEQKRIYSEAQKDPAETDIYATNGFVTFAHQKTAEIALMLQINKADDEWVVSHPPAPADVIYTDLEQTIAGRTIWTAVGYVAIGGLFMAYMPVVLAISQACNPNNLPKALLKQMGSWKDIFASITASFGLTVMACFLPTFLMFIFNICFTLKAGRWAQLHLQTYYFWFLILFVLLVTSIGSSLSGFVTELAQSPFLIFSILADQMPFTTHFYMNFVVMQWTTDSMSMIRYAQVMKYWVFKHFMTFEDARQMAEPEDQDYYGMGGRSARFSLVLTIGLVFSSICPLLVVLVFISLFCSRLFFGFLIPYVEQRKVDLGGSHFALQLIHANLVLLIYIILMTGLTMQRAATYGPSAISASAFLWWAISFYRFRHKLRWETLPYEDVCLTKAKKKRVSSATKYQQTALDPKVLDYINANPFANPF